jgi:hypothetical protein
MFTPKQIEAINAGWPKGISDEGAKALKVGPDGKILPKEVTQPNSSTDPFAAYLCVKKLGPIKTENRDGKSMKFVQSVEDNTDVNIGGFNYTLSSIKFFENGDAVIGGKIVKKFSCGTGREIIIDDVKITPKLITKPVVQIPKELKDSEGVKKFQNWMDSNHPNWVKGSKNLNKGGGYGKFGPSTSAAWSKYKNEYLGGSKTTDNTNYPVNKMMAGTKDFPGAFNTGGIGVPDEEDTELYTTK